jgi:hypothetical protein
VFLAVDPKHGRHGAPTWRPLEFANAQVISAVGVAS